MDLPDDFLDFEAKVNELANIFKDKTELTYENEKTENGYDIDVENVQLKVGQDRTILNRNVDNNDKPNGPASNATQECAQLDAATFMKQTEEDANERARQRKERESHADYFKKRASAAFRKNDLEEAVFLYTQAIDQVKDSVISHANRALCYYKLKNYRRAIMDCDFVVNKLHEQNIRILLYRAACCKRLNDNPAFEETIAIAKHHHPNRLEFIDKFADKIVKGEF